MRKIRSIEDLNAVREEYASRIQSRLPASGSAAVRPNQALVCLGTGCIASGAGEFLKALTEELEKAGLAEDVRVIGTGCQGPCACGPVMTTYPGGAFYVNLGPGDAESIVRKHFVGGEVVEEKTYRKPDGTYVRHCDDLPFFEGQVLRVFRNRGRIDPASIGEYIARDGYQAAYRAIADMASGEIIEMVKASGLRGRGGGGFPTGLKWSFAAKSPGDQKYVLCNADEGDPGAFMDCSTLESDPHAVIEGMIVAARAVNANRGVVYVRAEYPTAIDRLGRAISSAREIGLLGDDVFGSGFCFDIEMSKGAGAFVCGEETGLINSIEGRRGEPRVRPPFPAVKGLWGRPSVLNNVETYANIPPIILKGAEWFSSLGTEKSKGTKAFCVTGDVENIGLIEVPMGTTLRTIVYDIGGGIPGGKSFKAAQLGGPSGGCIPAEHLDTPIDYESLLELGAMMGSGGMIIMDEDTCMVDVARFFMDFVQDESCGKCPPCRVGTKRMHEILTDICEGRGSEGDIERLLELARGIKSSALCGLGQTAPNPVLSTIRHFRSEYEAHVRDKRCPAGICRALITYLIDSAKCTGCGACAKVCPAEAVSGEKKKPHSIDQDRCIKCGACLDTCRFEAVTVE